MIPMHLLLFDIDGTLLHTNGLSKALFTRALSETAGVAIEWSYAQYFGQPDRHLARDLLARAGLSELEIQAALPRAFTRIGDLWSVEGPAAEMVVYPGVRRLLADLARRRDVLLGQLTANARPAARGKLRAAGLDEARFPLGADGDEADERDDLPALALARAAAYLGRPLLASDVVIIGDSPADIRCARAIGARSVAVATGRHTLADLAAYHPDALLPDLTDRRQTLTALFPPRP